MMTSQQQQVSVWVLHFERSDWSSVDGGFAGVLGVFSTEAAAQAARTRAIIGAIEEDERIYPRTVEDDAAVRADLDHSFSDETWTIDYQISEWPLE